MEDDKGMTSEEKIMLRMAIQGALKKVEEWQGLVNNNNVVVKKLTKGLKGFRGVREAPEVVPFVEGVEAVLDVSEVRKKPRGRRPGSLTPEGRRKISEAARRRWARVRRSKASKASKASQASQAHKRSKTLSRKPMGKALTPGRRRKLVA
jgi:hypothetical protein